MTDLLGEELLTISKVYGNSMFSPFFSSISKKASLDNNDSKVGFKACKLLGHAAYHFLPQLNDIINGGKDYDRK